MITAITTTMFKMLLIFASMGMKLLISHRITPTTISTSTIWTRGICTPFVRNKDPPLDGRGGLDYAANFLPPALPELGKGGLWRRKAYQDRRDDENDRRYRQLRGRRAAERPGAGLGPQKGALPPPVERAQREDAPDHAKFDDECDSIGGGPERGDGLEVPPGGDHSERG